MQAPRITLFDLDSELDYPFSPRVWAIRLQLNYKQISYKTTWVGFSDIGTVLAAAGAPPTRAGTALKYTVPALIDGDTVISDSRVIAEYLERTYPVRLVPFRGQAEKKAIEANVVAPLMPLVVPWVVHHLDARDAAYFVQSRRESWGKELHEICPPSKREEMISALENGLSKLSEFVGDPASSDSGGWIFGDQDGPAYEDFELVGWFLWLKVAGLPGLWERIKELNGARWAGLLAAAEPYMSVD